MTARAVAQRPTAGPTLVHALDALLASATSADSTRIAAAESARALVRYFGADRPLGDFGGRRGARLAAAYLRNETGRRRPRRPGARRGPIGYGAARARLGVLRRALELAHAGGQLARMPASWPIPRPGAEGHWARGTYVLMDQAQEMRRQYPPRKRAAPETSRCSISPGPGGGVTLGTALARLTNGSLKRRAAATQAMRLEHAGHLVRFFGADRPLADFQGPAGYRLLLDFAGREGPEEGGRGVRFCTIRKRLGTLALALKEAIRRGELAALPPWPDLPADAAPRERYLSMEEYRRLREAIAPRWRLFIDLGCFTGMHTSDLESASWGMVDLGSGPGAAPGRGPAFFLRRNTKNRRRPEWLPMPDELRRHLTDAWIADRRTGAPEPKPDDRIVGKWHAVRRALRNACCRLGIPPVAPIDLRRTCATLWIEAGGPKDALKRWLGHAATSAMVDRHYLKVTVAMTAEGVDALNRAARRGAPSDVAAAPPALPPLGGRS